MSKKWVIPVALVIIALSTATVAYYHYRGPIYITCPEEKPYSAGSGITTDPVRNPNSPLPDVNQHRYYILEVQNGEAKCRLTGPNWYEQHKQQVFLGAGVIILGGFALGLWRINHNVKRLKR